MQPYPFPLIWTYVCLGTEPECRRTVGLLNYIRVDDCQSEEKIELTYCEVSRAFLCFIATIPWSYVHILYLSSSLTHRETVAVSLCTHWTSTRSRASVCVAQLQARCPWMFPCAVLTAHKHTTKSSPSPAATACHTLVRPTESRHLIK